MLKGLIMGVLNPERRREIEFLVQKLSDDHSLSRETVALIVTAAFHRMGQMKKERGIQYISKVITYASEKRRIAKGTWNYLDKNISTSFSD